MSDKNLRAKSSKEKLSVHRNRRNDNLNNLVSGEIRRVRSVGKPSTTG